ncbi:MAG: glycoside hydrolase family 18 protein [Bacteroidaceae bacterium]|nr:glycoside hydrolase family 18 protein [Bacteroidaceae bacterium]
MIKKSIIFVLLAVFALPLPAQQDTEKKIVAYVTSWTSITPDPMVMTHINYAFGGVGNDGKSVYADNVSRMQQLVRLKSKNPKLKVLLSIGGWGRGNFSPMAKDEEKRLAFAKACRTFCEKYNLDGIDIDWEFPGNNSSGETSPSDEKQNYTLLMRDLRDALGNDLLLTMASSADPGYYDFKNCIQYLDFVNVMTYDMSGPPNHHSALYRGGKVGNGWLVQSESIQKHKNAGIPVSKLVMGLAFYGNSGSGSQISLQEIKNGIASGKWKDNWDDTAKVPYVTDTSNKFAYGYDDDRSLTIKCQYIVKQKLAGAMYWEYANDDNKGTERNTVYECLLGKTYDNLKIGETPLNHSGSNTYTAGFGNGGEFTPRGTYRISIGGRLFTITNTTTEKGNIQLRSTSKITEGQTFIFTLDTSDIAKSILTVEDSETGVAETYECASAPTLFYNLQGQRISKPHSGNIYIAPPEKGGWNKVLR